MHVCKCMVVLRLGNAVPSMVFTLHNILSRLGHAVPLNMA